MFEDKRILLGITGSIAAYKINFLVRLLKKEGAEVRVVLTPSALEFVTPLTLATLSENPVLSDFTLDENTGEWANHVDLGLWADLFIVAPATANSMSKMANGEADNFLLATYLSAKCPVLIAPAMDLDMYKHGSTKDNLDKLIGYGNKIIPVGRGELASGLSGEGRMAEPEEIVDFAKKELFPKTALTGKKVLISAGPTLEAIDPIRFISNRSTGKMGFRLAEQASKMGAEVTLVSGPTRLELNDSSINRIDIESAEELYQACKSHFSNSDILIMAAAVADYTPQNVAEKKIKKKDGDLSIDLKRTTDILATLGQEKNHQVLVGFALETNNALENATAKLERKNLDYIVLNTLEDKGAGFGGDTNKITVIGKNNNILNFELKSKTQVAKDILKILSDHYENS